MDEPQYTVASDSETTGEEKSSSAFAEIAIGIDIGTSQCSIAVWNGSQVELLKNTRNQKLMRSYVTFKDEIPSGGVSNQISHECEIFSGVAIFNMKRLIVNNAWRSTTPEEVLAIFLVELRVMAELQLKKPIRNVVLTIPVSFSRFQLTRIERACAMAGLHILRLMPEPTAVALLYAQQQQQTVHENMGSGRAAIGGEDILQNMMQYLLPNSEGLFLNHRINEIKLLGLLRVATEDAIHRLSSQSSVQVDVDLGNGFKIYKVVTREEFEQVNLEVFEKCGCSYIPKIRNVVMAVCKREELYKEINPLEAAVCGAALEGAVASGITDPFGRTDQPPFMEVRMPTIDDGHGWCVEALNRTYGSTLDLVTVQKKM
ncbi:hypothetical protein OIU76_011353 [Salix suchowensis]|nr:hypothetical protein OIU76_011353 [Salix suchowensis]